MTKRKLPQYKGPITPGQAAAGMNAATANARRLADAASTLLDAGQCATAASLAVLSIEESGKVSILRSLVLAQSDDELKQGWLDYRSHTRKNVMWLLPGLAAEGARRLDDFKPLFQDEAEHPFLLDQVKQVGFYTDCLGSAHWSVPAEVIDKELATGLLRTARILAGDKHVTEREMELWVKFLGPVWRGPKELMEMALVRWYTAMQDEGLADQGENAMEEFILRGVPWPPKAPG